VRYTRDVESARVTTLPKGSGMTELKSSDYVHLHNHTQFSLLDGLTRIPELIAYAKESGMEAVAMTDHGTLSGAIEFYKEAVRPTLLLAGTPIKTPPKIRTVTT
jgi:DNA polymerase III alpha subunit (gram-positive type)